MGFRICYLASTVPGIELANAMGLDHTTTQSEMPAGDWWVATLVKSGWTILWSEDEKFGRHSLSRIADLSRVHDVYLCEVNETVMWSSSEFWKGGQNIWKVTHAGDSDVMDLTEVGHTPDGLKALKETHLTAQSVETEAVDHIFEIPLNLAALDIGFRHEDYLEPSDVGAFQVLQPRKKQSLLQRLLKG